MWGIESEILKRRSRGDPAVEINRLYSTLVASAGTYIPLDLHHSMQSRQV